MNDWNQILLSLTFYFKEIIIQYFLQQYFCILIIIPGYGIQLINISGSYLPPPSLSLPLFLCRCHYSWYTRTRMDYTFSSTCAPTHMNTTRAREHTQNMQSSTFFDASPEFQSFWRSEERIYCLKSWDYYLGCLLHFKKCDNKRNILRLSYTGGS